MKDFLERKIYVGDMLVYPVRRGSKMWLTKSRVVGLGDGFVYGVNDNGRRVTLSRPERSIIAPSVVEIC